jgi:hypothetical protein
MHSTLCLHGILLEGQGENLFVYALSHLFIYYTSTRKLPVKNDGKYKVVRKNTFYL